MLYSFLLVFLFQLMYTGGKLIIQSSSLTADVGTNVTLICDIANAFGRCVSVRWLLHQEENGLTLYLPGIRNMTRNAQQDILCSLTIQTSLSDNGTFYCLLLNEGMDYIGNGTMLTVMAPDITSRQKVNTYDHIDLQQVKEHQCLIPLAVLGGIVLLIIMGILSICAFYKRPSLMHQRDSNVSEQHQQSSSETQYATLKFITGRHERVLKS